MKKALQKNIHRLTFGFLLVTSILTSKGAIAAYNQSILIENYRGDRDCRILEEYHEAVAASLPTDSSEFSDYPVPGTSPAEVHLSENSGALLPTGPVFPTRSIFWDPSHFFWRLPPQNFLRIWGESPAHAALVNSAIGPNQTTIAVGPLPTLSGETPTITSRALGLSPSALIDRDRGAEGDNTILVNALGNDGQKRNAQTITPYLAAPFLIFMGTLQADSDGRFAIAAINSGENGLPTLYVPSNAPLPWENGNCIVEESTSAATGFGVNALLPFVQHYADHLPLVYAAAFLTADPLTFEDADDFVEFLKNPSHREGGVLNIDRMQAFLEQVYQQGLQDTPYQLLSVQTEVSVVPNEHYAQEIRVQFTAPVSALSIQITNNELAQFEGRTDVSIWLTSPWGSTVPLLNRGEPNHGILRSGYPAFEGARDHTGAGAWELVISSKDSALPMLHVDTNTFAIEVGGYDADSALGQMTHNGIAQQLGVTENTLLIAATDAAKQTATDHNIPSGQPVNRAGADDPLTDTRQQISEDVPYGITVVWAAMDILAKTIGALLPKRKPDRNLIQSAVRQQEKDDHEIGG